MWQELYETAAAHLDAAAGYYNNNVRVDTPSGPVNVRIPIHGADTMDLRLWQEEEILPAIASYVEHAPRLLHVSHDPRFQVHEFIEGQVLNAIAPRGVAVPAHVPADVARLLAGLVEVPREKLPATPPDWPDADDTSAFGRRLSAIVCATGNLALKEKEDDFVQVANGAYIASVTSSDDELELAALEGLYERTSSGENRLLHAALRELGEETGISWHGVTTPPGHDATPVDIDVHTIPANPAKGEPEYWHADFRWAFWVKEPKVVLQAEEVDGYAWRPRTDAPTRKLAAIIREHHPVNCEGP